MSEAFTELGQRKPTKESLSSNTPYLQKPKLLTLGGDHSIALAALRGLSAAYEKPLAVVHFDAHLDTWNPDKYPSTWIDPNDPNTQSFFTHGTMFWMAADEGLIANGSSIHAGLRTRLTDPGDNEDDTTQGWTRISTDDIDDIGTKGIISTIIDRIPPDYP
ncbi:hypothetical protein LTR28_012094, partial [Elasticomyces elasticus]